MALGSCKWASAGAIARLIDITDVNGAGLANDDLIQWDDPSSKWVMKDIDEILAGQNVSVQSLSVSGAPPSPPIANTLYKKNILKAWAHINGTATPATLADGFNIGAFADVAVGLYRVFWDVDFADANYAFAGMASTEAFSCFVA